MLSCEGARSIVRHEEDDVPGRTRPPPAEGGGVVPFPFKLAPVEEAVIKPPLPSDSRIKGG